MPPPFFLSAALVTLRFNPCEMANTCLYATIIPPSSGIGRSGHKHPFMLK
jgi:hypothetical protein